MIAVALSFAGRHWKVLLLAAVIGAASVQTYRVGRLKGDAAELKATIATVKRERDGWKASYRLSEDIRRAEQADAITSATQASSACDARIAEARRSARAIETIITKEVRRDPQGCPVRELVPSDQLRDALRPSR